MATGRLVRWFDDRGYGFVAPDDGGGDVYLHISDVRGASRRPAAGDGLRYRVARDGGGRLRARDAAITTAARAPARPAAARARHGAGGAWWVLLPALLIVPVGGAAALAASGGGVVPLAAYAVMSCAAFVATAIDKGRAQSGEWRIAEATLHALEWAGGWPGAFAAQRIVRHKCSKTAYQLEFWAIVVAHHAGWIVWAVRAAR